MNTKHMSLFSLLFLVGFVNDSKTFSLFNSKLTEEVIIAADNCGQYNIEATKELLDRIKNELPTNRTRWATLKKATDRAETNKHKHMAQLVKDIVKAKQLENAYPWYAINHIQALELLTENFDKEEIEKMPSSKASKNCSDFHNILQDFIYSK